MHATPTDVPDSVYAWDLLVSTSLPSGDLTHYGSSPLTCYRSLRYISSPRSNDNGGRCPIFTPGRLCQPVGHKVSRLCTWDFRCRLQMRSWLNVLLAGYRAGENGSRTPLVDRAFSPWLPSLTSPSPLKPDPVVWRCGGAWVSINEVNPSRAR